MKVWIFALLEAGLAAFGLVAYFVTNNWYLTTAAVVIAALVGIAQPFLSAVKARKLSAFQDQQWDKSLGAVDDQLQALLADVIEPPLPHAATVRLILAELFSERSDELVAAYDRLADAIEANDDNATRLAEAFSVSTSPEAIGPYLQGLVALRAGDAETAYRFFCEAKERRSGWILPWLGWATAAWQSGQTEELRTQHPHICGVELLPYDCGNDTTFIKLSEEQREELTNMFQTCARSLGNYYTIAEYQASHQQIETSREEYKKVA